MRLPDMIARPRRFARWLQYTLERWLLRGAHIRLAFIAAIIVLFSLLGGLLVLRLSPGFDDAGDAVWWAFLRLSDPGYLGDDEGLAPRAVSTVLTVLGYVLFMGSLVAIMSQWLNATIDRLQRAETPVAKRNHFLILGWTGHSASVIRELMLSEQRARHFLARRGGGSFEIVLLADRVGPELRSDLKTQLGPFWNEARLTLRSGSRLRLEHLNRVDALRAAAILIPGGDAEDGRHDTDGEVIKTILSIANHPQAAGRGPQGLPRVVAEIADRRRVELARRAYPGVLDVLPGDRTIARLAAQAMRHPGLSQVSTELLTQLFGNSLWLPEVPAFAGRRFGEAAEACNTGIVLGILRPGEDRPRLAPVGDTTLEPGDRLVVVAPSPTAALPDARRMQKAVPPAATEPIRPRELARHLRVLVLGWNKRLPALIEELAAYADETFALEVLSRVPTATRDRDLAGLDPAARSRVRLLQHEGDFTIPEELAALEPAGYDRILIVGSDWLDSSEETDARSLVADLVLQSLLPAADAPPILLELTDPANASLFAGRPRELLVSPLVLSHQLAQIAMRPELARVFDELFGSGGAEIHFDPVERFGLAGRELHFRDVGRLVRSAGAVALGLRLAAGRDEPHGGVELNPPTNDLRRFRPGDELIVLYPG